MFDKMGLWLAKFVSALSRGVAKSERVHGDMTYREACQMLMAYYMGNDVYRLLKKSLKDDGIYIDDLREMRNPAYRVPEFYVSTIWPGPAERELIIESENETLEPAIHKLWKDSRWDAAKQVAVREFAICGDVFIRVATIFTRSGSKKIVLQVLNSEDITAFDVDLVGNIIFLRLDIRTEVRNIKTGTNEFVSHTEIWDPEKVRIWNHPHALGAGVDTMGDPETTTILLEEMGIDFVPIVHAPFKDLGETIGMPAIWPVLSLIDEVNRKATRLAQLMFRYNDPIWALQANLVDSDGTPAPPPQIKTDGAATTTTTDDGTIEMGSEKMVSLPGNTSLDLLVPNINYAEYANAIAADMEEIASSLPEMRWYDLARDGVISGVALRLKMGPAIERVLEARSNIEFALTRADQMAITIGQSQELDVYKDVKGTFEEGDFDHSFAVRPVFPLSEVERVDIALKYKELGVPVPVILVRYNDWSPDEVENVINDLGLAQNEALIGSPRLGRAVTIEEQDAVAGTLEQELPVQNRTEAALAALRAGGGLEAITARRNGNGS